MALSLSHQAGYGPVWRVDDTALLVRQRPEGWRVTLVANAGDPVHQAVKRHGLIGMDFATRRQAVDAVRMMLDREPLVAIDVKPLTQWIKTGEGVYRSRDDQWQLVRCDDHDQLIQINDGKMGLTTELASGSLRQAAVLADVLNQQRRWDENNPRGLTFITTACVKPPEMSVFDWHQWDNSVDLGMTLRRRNHLSH